MKLRFLKKHGRKFAQDHWRAEWKTNKDRVYWEEQARWLRLHAKTGTG